MNNTKYFQFFLITILLSSIFIFSCNFGKKKENDMESNIKEIVTINTYRIWDDSLDEMNLEYSYETYIDTRYIFGRKNFVYALNDSIFVESPYSIEKDSFFLANKYCPNLDTIQLKYHDEMVELIISHYSDSDDSNWVFWNHDYGIAALDCYHWYNLITIFEKETMEGFAKNILLDYILNQKKEETMLIMKGIEPEDGNTYMRLKTRMP